MGLLYCGRQRVGFDDPPEVHVRVLLEDDAAGDLARLGHVTVTGTVAGLGFIASGHASGTLTFTNARGSVTVTLVCDELPPESA